MPAIEYLLVGGGGGADVGGGGGAGGNGFNGNANLTHVGGFGGVAIRLNR